MSSDFNKDALLRSAKRINVSYFKEQQEDAINAIWQWWQSQSISFTLSGYAGTGKTFIMRHLVRYLIVEKVCVTAPTHKALRVLENSSGKKGMTIQSLCGLRPDVDIEDYNIENPSFKVIGEQKIRGYRLVIIDECSMINPGLFNLLIKTAIQCRCKLLFLGDELQIPYVVAKGKGEEDTYNRISPSFTHTDVQFRLTQIVRQEAGILCLNCLVLFALI